MALVNRHTGDVRFAQKIEEFQRYLPQPKDQGSISDWQEVHLVVEDEGQTVHFRLTDAKGARLPAQELDPLAMRILFETLDVLNRLAALCQTVSASLPESEVVQDLSDIHIARVGESITTVPGWAGHLSRLDAERKLEDKTRGAYLLREAEDWESDIAIQIGNANQTSVTVYVLTFVQEGDRIAEKLLLETERGWAVCKDESDLSLYAFYPNLPSLLKSMEEELEKPI
jgi:hypothetical protein